MKTFLANIIVWLDNALDSLKFLFLLALTAVLGLAALVLVIILLFHDPIITIGVGIIAGIFLIRYLFNKSHKWAENYLSIKQNNKK